jgi:hypothetical protein
MPAVRVAVLEGLQLLVDNQHAQPVLNVSNLTCSLLCHHLMPCFKNNRSLSQQPCIALFSSAVLCFLVSASNSDGYCCRAVLLLQKALPQLAPVMWDNSPRVREAMADLLLCIS